MLILLAGLLVALCALVYVMAGRLLEAVEALHGTLSQHTEAQALKAATFAPGEGRKLLQARLAERAQRVTHGRP